MRNKPISDLRRRMIEDMTVRSFSDKTKRGYLRHVEALAAFLGRSPDTVTGDDLRQFQLHQVEHGAQPSKLNSQASGLRFFFTITLGRPDLTHQLVRTNYSHASCRRSFRPMRFCGCLRRRRDLGSNTKRR